MSSTSDHQNAPFADQVPLELLELKERLLLQPAEIRAELEPLIDEALEHARFRRRAMLLARDALEQFRLDLALLRYDLEATQREREALRAMLKPE
jgi:hypothetical protein